MLILLKEKDEPCGAMKIVAAAANCVGKESTVIMVNMQKPKLILWGFGGGGQTKPIRRENVKKKKKNTAGALMYVLYVDNVVYLN